MKLATALLGILLAANVHADRFANVEISAIKVADGIHMLTGAGGNIGVSAGSDGLLIIDDQFAPLAERISQALVPLAPAAQGKPKFVINTHHHADHTGSNPVFGQQATIFAHHNVLKHLQQDDKVSPAAYPVVTYNDGVTFHFNSQTIQVMHLGQGHTDGDSMVWFPQQNVLHMGDLFFEGRFPFVDLDHGGSVRAYLARVQQALELVDDDSQIIPGHGKLANKQDLKRFEVMLTQSLAWAESMSEHPQSVWQQQGLPQHLKPFAWQFISEGRWINTLWRELKD